MRENLIGYLLNAVEPEERAVIEQHLQQDQQLQNDLNVLGKGIAPLAADEHHHQPPAGLAQRCCEYVFNCAAVMPAQLSALDSAAAGDSARRWSWLDLSVAGGIAVAVAVLLLPAIYQSHIQSQLLACQNNLKDLGLAMADYSTHNGGYYPAMQPGDRLNVDGTWAPTLVGQSYPVSNELVCPSSKLADEPEFRVPTIRELRAMSDAQLAQELPRLGGSYGYTLGYRDDHTYKTPQYLRRTTYAVMADKPGNNGTNSPNHGFLGQNVLRDDGSVRYLKTTRMGSDSNIYTNERGEIAPGLSENDSVIAPSEQRADFSNP